MLKISIATVCLNSEDTLEPTIKSVLSQDYPNIEFIIVDGASTDGTLDIINKYSSRITKWISEKDDGLYYAMNKAIDLASGDWILFMNSGDRFASNDVISRVFSPMKEQIIPENVKFIFGDTIIKYSFGNFLVPGIGSDGIFNFYHQSSFYKVEEIKRVKYDVSYKLIADSVCYKSIVRDNSNRLYVPITISVYDCESGVSSRNPFLILKEKKRKYGAGGGKYVIAFTKCIISTYLMPRKYIAAIRKKHLKRMYIEIPQDEM